MADLAKNRLWTHVIRISYMVMSSARAGLIAAVE